MCLSLIRKGFEKLGFSSCHAGLARPALDAGIRHLLPPSPPSVRLCRNYQKVILRDTSKGGDRKKRLSYSGILRRAATGYLHYRLLRCFRCGSTCSFNRLCRNYQKVILRDTSKGCDRKKRLSYSGILRRAATGNPKDSVNLPFSINML